jgi:NAD(P) transhydrogenase subunit alpha
MAEETKQLIIGVPKETFPNENRVAVTADIVQLFIKSGMNVIVEPGAGLGAGISDETYKAKGAEVAENRKAVFNRSEVILQVRGFGANPANGGSDLDLFRDNQSLISFFEPLTSKNEIKAMAERGVNLFAIEMMPRITRAQSMDALSSMATIAGYKAVLLAAEMLPKMFPMLMTAAGTISPARVFIIGAGVAGLQAIASAKRLGAIVKAYDVRPVVKEQVESLGATFVEMEIESADSEDKGGYAREMDEEFYRKQRELMKKVVADSDVVITTAAIPGKTAPILITGDMVAGMNRGSVIVDLAAERGGNCEPSIPDETVVKDGVTILGPINLPSTVPFHASQMYSRNLLSFLKHLVKDGAIDFNLEDEILKDTLLTRHGKIINARIKEIFGIDDGSERRSD